MIKRELRQNIEEMLSRQAAVGLLGPRQVGKTTLALQIGKQIPSVYFDLESPSDLAKLSEPEMYLKQYEDKLVILDEIQRQPDLFQILRGIIDKGKQAGKKLAVFLFLVQRPSTCFGNRQRALQGEFHMQN